MSEGSSIDLKKLKAIAPPVSRMLWMTECSVSSMVHFKCARMSKSDYDMLSLHIMFLL